MSDSTASLRRQIDSAGDLQSVVRTMKALAASSIGQYEESARALGDYSRTVELGLRTCFRQLRPLGSPAGQSRGAEPAVTRAVVFGSDQGLVGRFNESVADCAIQTLKRARGKVEVYVVGTRVHERLSDACLPLVKLFSVPSSVTAIAPLAGELLVASNAQRSPAEVSELYLFYNQRGSASGYAPIAQRLLPLDAEWHRKLTELRWPTGNLPEVVGSATATAQALIGEYLFIALFRACAESLASENASRLAAMQRADKNIDDLLENLNDTFHRLRQSGIDEELFDVVAGSEALRKS